MAVGDMLAQAKAKLSHGEWLPWLKDNCLLSERTAQRYMAAAERRKELEEKLKDKSATVADFLTLKDVESSAAIDAAVLRANKADGGGKTKDGDGRKTTRTLSDQIDSAIESLIKKLKEMKQQNADNAIAAATELVSKLRLADLLEEGRRKAA
jgi:hypothetical protein